MNHASVLSIGWSVCHCDGAHITNVTNYVTALAMRSLGASIYRIGFGRISPGYPKADVKGQQRSASAECCLRASPRRADISFVPAPLQLMQQHVNCLEKQQLERG